jgi:hypothetical protein
MLEIIGYSLCLWFFVYFIFDLFIEGVSSYLQKKRDKGIPKGERPKTEEREHQQDLVPPAYPVPTTHRQRTKPWETEYTQDWKSVSRAVRIAAGWRCQSCGVNLNKNRNLLHTHHKNRMKNDNRKSNLVALCVVCHCEQPYHYRLEKSTRKSGVYQETLRLRKNQGIGL